MKISNKLRRTLSAALVLAAAGVLTLGGCTKVDDTLGSNLVPENQQMKAGYVSLPGLGKDDRIANYVRTRLFQTDSIKSSNINNGYFGAMISDTFGLRTAGFLSQYVSYYKIDDGYFGFRPIFDSAQILLSVASYGTDTMTVQEFEVYEVISNDYLTKKPLNKDGKLDTLFYIGFDPRKAETTAGEADVIGATPLFTFELGGDKGPATKAVTMKPTQAGENFIKRLMLQDKDDKNKYSIYSADSLKYFVEEFKGLYITPSQKTINELAGSKGTVFGTELDASGFAVYGRNRVESDPSLVKDTIGMVFYFYDSYAKHGNVSVNSVKNYDNAKFNYADAREVKEGQEDNRPDNPTVFVAGMGGVVTEITFGKEFFDELDAIIKKENDTSNKQFRTLAFSQARMSIYIWGSNYDWTQISGGINTPHLIGQMNASQSRLGLYTNYKTLAPISDYAYAYEASYGTQLAYGGYINRSRGCYVMDISAYMQELWNNYIKEKEATPAGQPVNFDNVKKRTIYLGPEAYGLYTPTYSVAMGMTGESGVEPGKNNDFPIRFDLTYNMIK